MKDAATALRAKEKFNTHSHKYASPYSLSKKIKRHSMVRDSNDGLNIALPSILHPETPSSPSGGSSQPPSLMSAHAQSTPSPSSAMATPNKRLFAAASLPGGSLLMSSPSPLAVLRQRRVTNLPGGGSLSPNNESRVSSAEGGGGGGEGGGGPVARRASRKSAPANLLQLHDSKRPSLKR